MGKVHGSLARAGKVKSQTPFRVFFFGGGGGNHPKNRSSRTKTREAPVGKRRKRTTLDVGDGRRRKSANTTDAMTDRAMLGTVILMKHTEPLADHHDSPKVEPQEKKKTPKGRAKKRLTYTRRFVNVTLTGGKRKMNPNPTS
ncbi:40S ribosomal protein S30-B [Colletotrichum liriopes]|uniref:40S ribosomal protein S30-B n=1 Tax=Colletotrichum liriopes TaxID=708192 RepID=A0AA37GKV2_9PEZI|nr:40S ribosomal protein S30-B [Colletotrichum liriopes]